MIEVTESYGRIPLSLKEKLLEMPKKECRHKRKNRRISEERAAKRVAAEQAAQTPKSTSQPTKSTPKRSPVRSSAASPAKRNPKSTTPKGKQLRWDLLFPGLETIATSVEVEHFKITADLARKQCTRPSNHALDAEPPNGWSPEKKFDSRSFFIWFVANMLHVLERCASHQEQESQALERRRRRRMEISQYRKS